MHTRDNLLHATHDGLSLNQLGTLTGVTYCVRMDHLNDAGSTYTYIPNLVDAFTLYCALIPIHDDSERFHFFMRYPRS
jgi:hypothetical protein